MKNSIIHWKTKYRVFQYNSAPQVSLQKQMPGLKEKSFLNGSAKLCAFTSLFRMSTSLFTNNTNSCRLSLKRIDRKCYSTLNQFWDVRSSKEGTLFHYKNPMPECFGKSGAAQEQFLWYSIGTMSGQDLLLIWTLTRTREQSWTQELKNFWRSLGLILKAF